MGFFVVVCCFILIISYLHIHFIVVIILNLCPFLSKSINMNLCLKLLKFHLKSMVVKRSVSHEM